MYGHEIVFGKTTVRVGSLNVWVALAYKSIVTVAWNPAPTAKLESTPK